MDEFLESPIVRRLYWSVGLGMGVAIVSAFVQSIIISTLGECDISRFLRDLASAGGWLVLGTVALLMGAAIGFWQRSR